MPKNQCDWNRLNLDLFIDRDRIAERLAADLPRGDSSVIFGGRKMGKSLLLKQIAIKLGKRNIPFAHINFQAAPQNITPRWIFEQIATSLAPITPNAKWRGDFVSSCRQLILSIGAEFPRIIFLFDESDVIASRRWTKPFFGNLNYLLFTDTDVSMRLSIAISGGRALQSTSEGMMSSPLLLRLTPYELKNFTRREASRLISLAGFSGNKAATTGAIYSYTSGHPALMQFALGRLQKSARSPLISILKDLDRASTPLCEANYSKLSSEAKELIASVAVNGRFSSRSRGVIDAIERGRIASQLVYTGLISSTTGQPIPMPQSFRTWIQDFQRQRSPLNWRQAIQKAETLDVELKASAFLDVDEFLKTGERKKHKGLLPKISQAVVGFWNTDGGTLIVGILEGRGRNVRALGKVFPKVGENFLVGLQDDFKLLNGDWDTFSGAIIGHINERVGAIVCRDISMETEPYRGHAIGIISVPRGSRYFCYDDEFYIRLLGRTQRLSTKDALAYQAEHPR